MKQISYLLFSAFFIISILHTAQVRANGRDGGFKSEREKDHDWKYDRDHDTRETGWQPRVSRGGSAEGGERAPIDGGLSLLLAAGIGLGVKKVFGKNKQHKEEDGENAGQ